MTFNLMLLGAVTMASFLISLFFLRFWRTTKDRFFLFFSLSFFLEASSRVLLGATNYGDEYEPLIYSVRLLAFLFILYAIIDKNLRGKSPGRR